ncbi:hypothetical protein D3C71_1850130 [compost metagenome]
MQAHGDSRAVQFDTANLLQIRVEHRDRLFTIVGHEEAVLAVTVDPRRVRTSSAAMGHLQGFHIDGDDAVVATGGHIKCALVLAETIALGLAAGLQ